MSEAERPAHTSPATSGRIRDIELQINSPFDAKRLGKLLRDKNDLFLVWPDARYPFDAGQWESEFKSRESASYFVVLEGKDIGHIAILPGEDAGTFTLAFIYVVPQMRSQGIGKKMIEQIASIAHDQMHANALTLAVRDYNPNALKAYVGAGFHEVGREGTKIKMRKELH